jgi:crossover junction endodeoxyribonuclease RuvC
MGFAAFLGDSLIDYCIRTIPSVQSIRERLVRMEEVVSRYIDEKNPHALAIEKTAFSQSAQNGIVVLAYYKILAVARRRHLPVYEYAPITVRKLVCGYGRSTKDDVAKILISMYPELRIYRGLDRRFKARLMSDLYDAVAV